MGLERYLLHDFFTAQELNDLERRLTLQRSHDLERRRTTKARVDALEANLGRVAMLARALAELCLSKGLVSREELVQILLTADLADGKRDQKLNPAVVMPGESQTADSRPLEDPKLKKSKMKRRRPYP